MDMKRSYINAYMPIEVRFDVFYSVEGIDVFLWCEKLEGVYLKGKDEGETIRRAVNQFEEINGVKVELTQNSNK
ncbi:hypothetical protein M3936_17945 [Sutcliffiella horikoshii]|uniref:hypothetical protein n=1 Tax=Sutcliffiella horikoshii TaxID=79883 RepID=UPI00203F51E4|nr:hypothetical protein [Sutcliffiella horikoshii]MCM3619476.1 hypothetical protein [Sutcliffiella horikoshii]